MESDKIIATVKEMYSEADRKHWDQVRSVFADSVLMDYTSVNGGSPTVLTPNQIVKAWSAFDTLSHHVKDFRVTEIGSNEARVTYTGRTEHFLGEKEWVVEGNYETVLQKVNGVWLIHKHKITLIRQSGDTSLRSMARELANQ